MKSFRFVIKGLLVAIIGGGIFLAFTTNEKPIVYLVGDSTMSVKDVEAYPETGWGMPFVHYFTSGIEIENHARNGRSTRTFMEEGRWHVILRELKEGDYVFIQFGHNDEVPSKSRYTPPAQYQELLRQYISESLEKGATPILLTPITRRQFDDDGKVKETHEQYSELVREVAASEDVAIIDMDRKSQALLNEIGEEKSTLLFLQLKAGQNPHYPGGITDNT
ncbi:MAG: rhamnogalacturonan acetylesterase, partial [Gracilimonas sp.]